MAKLSMLTDRISEVQAKNLKMYPFVFFEGVLSAAIQYDLSNNLGVDTETKDEDLKYNLSAPQTNHLKVSYYLKIEEQLNHSLDRRFQAIEEAVRTIFWKQVKVEVFFNDKKMYESKNV